MIRIYFQIVWGFDIELSISQKFEIFITEVFEIFEYILREDFIDLLYRKGLYLNFPFLKQLF